MKERSCGECRACCTVFGVSELGKPYYRPCPHLTENGCGIYECRPASCRGFYCLWLDGVVPGDERWRPDNLGVIFGLSRRATLEGPLVYLEVWEVTEGVMATDRVRYLAHKLDHDLGVIQKVRWQPANLPVPVAYVIDGERWPQGVAFGDCHDLIRLEPQGGRDVLYTGITADIRRIDDDGKSVIAMSGPGGSVSELPV